MQVRDTPGAGVRAAPVSVLRRRHVRRATVPLRRRRLPLAVLLADGARSVATVPGVVDRRRRHGDGLPAVARRRRAVPDVGRLRPSTSPGARRRGWLVCPARRRAAVAALRETRHILARRRLRRRSRYSG